MLRMSESMQPVSFSLQRLHEVHWRPYFEQSLKWFSEAGSSKPSVLAVRMSSAL
jgi:hypothetical protein